MNKAEIISQLQSLRDSTAAYARGSDEEIFRKDVEALDAAIELLSRSADWVFDSRTIVPRCSRCGEDAIAETVSPYCPNCGAKMDEEDKLNA